MIVLPGGRIGVANLQRCDLVQEQCLRFSKGKMVAAVCAAPSILASLGLMEKATVHPDLIHMMCDVKVFNDPVIVDGNIITGQGLGATIPFALEIVKQLVGKEKAEQIKQGICYRG